MNWDMANVFLRNGTPIKRSTWTGWFIKYKEGSKDAIVFENDRGVKTTLYSIPIYDVNADDWVGLMYNNNKEAED